MSIFINSLIMDDKIIVADIYNEKEDFMRVCGLFYFRVPSRARLERPEMLINTAFRVFFLFSNCV